MEINPFGKIIGNLRFFIFLDNSAQKMSSYTHKTKNLRCVIFLLRNFCISHLGFTPWLWKTLLSTLSRSTFQLVILSCFFFPVPFSRRPRSKTADWLSDSRSKSLRFPKFTVNYELRVTFDRHGPTFVLNTKIMSSIRSKTNLFVEIRAKKILRSVFGPFEFRICFVRLRNWW